MTTTSTAVDVFSVAIKMEQTGKDFYRALALACDDAKVRDFCLRTAGDETRHETTFQQMQRQWAQDGGAGVLGAEQVASLAALAKGHIQPDPVAVRQTAIGGRLEDALAMAIEMEQDAIRFYEKLLQSLPGSAEALRAIAREEGQHLTNLRLLAR